MKHLVLIAALAVASPLHAQSWPDWASWNPFAAIASRPNPAVVRVIAEEGQGVTSLGSGTLVATSGTSGLVVTNWHVVKDAQHGVKVVFPDGFQSAGTVLKTDSNWDLAALAVWRPQVSPVPLATQLPLPGDTLKIAGYGSGNYREARGRFLQYLSPSPNQPYEIIEVGVTARQGDSGGPILNERGELAGVLFGEGGGRTSGSHCGRVKSFLGPLLPGTPQGVMQPEQKYPETGYSAVLPLATMPQNLAHGGPRSTSASANIARQVTTVPFGTPAAPVTPDGEFTPWPSEANGELSPGDESNPERVDLAQLAGSTPIERIKTALAAVGVLAVLLQLRRHLTPSAPAPAPPAPAS